jgi:hypothetical protein
VVLPEPSTNFSRMHEYRDTNSSIRGPFVDGLQPNHKINQNQQFSIWMSAEPDSKFVKTLVVEVMQENRNDEMP